MKKLTLLMLLLINSLSQLCSQSEIPKPKGFINDFTQTLTPQQERNLEDTVQAYFKKSGIQIGLALEATLNGSNEFDRSMELARTWGIGAKGENRGILIYISKKERKYHLLPSNKLQGDLTDGIVGEIGRNSLVPFLKNNDYPGGIHAVIYELMAQIQSPENLRAVEKPWFEELPLFPESALGKMTLFFASLLLFVILYFGLGKNIRSRFMLNKRAKELGIEIKPWTNNK
jgi:uncharacterized protein